MSLICSNPACLQKFTSSGGSKRHIRWSQKGCKEEHIQLLSTYLESLGKPTPSHESKCSYLLNIDTGQSKTVPRTRKSSLNLERQSNHSGNPPPPSILFNPPEEPIPTPAPLDNVLEHDQLPVQDNPDPDVYLKTATDDGFVYVHPTAGQSFGRERTKWDQLEELMRMKYPNKPYGIWKNRREWQIAHWMATKKVSQSDLNELLQTEAVSNST